MYTKALYVFVDCLATVGLFYTLRAIRRIEEPYGKWLKKAMTASAVAIFANILVALSFNSLSAEISYCTYFVSIDWIIYFLCCFCILYTEHDRFFKRAKIPAAVIMILDSVSLFLNLFLGHHFYIYENTGTPGVVFYQTAFRPFYYVHLAIDYVAILIALGVLIYRFVKSYSFYRTKYLIILGVLLFVIALNVAYMAFALVLDISVVFYAVAGTLIYFCVTVFVPKNLMNASIGRAVNDMNEGLILFDVTNHCIYVNAFAKKRFLINEKTYDFSCEPVKSVVADLKESGEIFGNATYVKRILKDSQPFSEHYDIKYHPLTDKKGHLIGSFFLIEDTTEEAALLSEISRARETADQANRAKSIFLASMSHEIRTPLNSVLGMNEMILRSTKDPQLLEYAGHIKTSGDVLLGLINDVLDFSKIEARKMDILEAPYDLHRILRDIDSFFSESAKNKGLYLKIACDENLPSRLIGDEAHIRQVLANIVSNAVKYTKEGGVTVSVSAEPQKEDRVMLLIKVTDTGIGIAAEDREYLFDAFRRVNERQNASIQGTGLGLAISKELMELMKGSILLDSRVGGGSTFTLRLPQKVEDANPAGSFVPHPPAQQETEYRESFHAPSASVLVVDDVSINLKVISALLKDTQIKVTTASDGLKAVGLCKEEKYDVILLDHRMPDPDGIATFGMIRKDGLNKETPVIMLTANALSGAEEEYRQLGFSAYLSKPVRGADLEKALLALLPSEKITQTASAPE
ncbi:MAG: response regulator [Lachnospiraceae bacterium]|nr:response regulator [Lachnospiraceae bacterium]